MISNSRQTKIIAFCYNFAYIWCPRWHNCRLGLCFSEFKAVHSGRLWARTWPWMVYRYRVFHGGRVWKHPDTIMIFNATLILLYAVTVRRKVGIMTSAWHLLSMTSLYVNYTVPTALNGVSLACSVYIYIYIYIYICVHSFVPSSVRLPQMNGYVPRINNWTQKRQFCIHMHVGKVRSQVNPHPNH